MLLQFTFCSTTVVSGMQAKKLRSAGRVRAICLRSRVPNTARTLSSSHVSLRYTHDLARKFAGGIIDTHTRDLHSKTLEQATRNTQKGVCRKIRHASDLLKRISPQKVRRRCPSAERMFVTLGNAITGA
jgi:hypothetical protein